MQNVFTMLLGSKTKLGAALLVLVALAELVGIDVVSTITPANAVEFVWGGIMVIFARDAMKK